VLVGVRSTTTERAAVAVWPAVSDAE
jgi:hypothetical protein